ncbi:MAG: hypothetical protein ACYDEA_04135 [Candidatus Dormibacteria bacterium]
MKVYGNGINPARERRYSPSRFVTAEKPRISGFLNMGLVSISDIERQDPTMPMRRRHFPRLTNGFSKKAENLAAAVSPHFMHYNFARPHKSLGNHCPRAAAMAAGVTDHVWTAEEIVGLLG